MSPVAAVESQVRAEENRSAIRVLRCTGPAQLSEEVIRKVDREGPLVLSELFLRFWTGLSRPSEELELWLNDRGYEIFPSVDYRPGFRVQKKGEKIQAGLWS